MATCLIGLGANLGDRQKTLDEAVARLSQHVQVKVVARSCWRETAPAGGPKEQPPFLNGAVVVETSLAPAALLGRLHEIEVDLGRRRDEYWGPRTLDLDLLLHDEEVIETASLVLPHPRMAWRRFVLEPAAEVGAAMLHPTTGWTVGRLLQHINTTPWYAAVTGCHVGRNTSFARQIAARTGSRLLALSASPSHSQWSCCNPSGHGVAEELEFLAAQARLLALDRPEWADDSTPVVSDFWFEQFPVLGRVGASLEPWHVFSRHFEQLRHAVVQPRLIVLLEVPGEDAASTIEPASCNAKAIRERTATRGPVLRITESNRSRAVMEAVAAIEAMK